MLPISLGLVGLLKEASPILVDIRLDQDYIRQCGKSSEFHGEVYGEMYQ